MAFAIIWTVFIGTAFLIAIIAEQKKDKKQREEMITFLQSSIKQTPFSVSCYYDRTQQQQESLQAEKENQEPYVVILWWNNDGLRLNDDGSFEWISKRKKKNENTQAQFPQMQNAQAISGTEIQTQIALLRYKLLMEQMQAGQIQQNQNIINSLQSAPYPQYIRYPAQCGINQYTPSLTWCCCQGNYIIGES